MRELLEKYLLGDTVDDLEAEIMDSDWLAYIRYDEYIAGFAAGFKEGAGVE